MYVGGNVDYQDETTAGFVDTCQEAGVSCTKTSVDIRDDLSDLKIKQRTLARSQGGGGFRRMGFAGLREKRY